VENVNRFHFTPHAARRLLERNISGEAVKDAITHHQDKDFKYLGEHGGKVSRYAKMHCNGKLIVIAELKKGECWIITTYYE
jgi:hypothetical protein